MYLERRTNAISDEVAEAISELLDTILVTYRDR